LRHADQPKFGGEAHFAHGLYQEGGTEWNNYDKWMQANHPGENWQYLANRNAGFARQGIPPLEAFTGPKRDLLETAKAAGTQNHTVTGDASLNIALNGFPKGTKTDLTYGGLFTKYELSRGQQMEQAEIK
jgi:hypothetical protein